LTPLRIAVAGLVALAVAMGIGRFAFTPLLPMMLAEHVIDLHIASWLASANYLGYLAGALLCTFQPWIWARVRGLPAIHATRLVRGGLVLRYDTAATKDGLPPGEGAFLPCSFWLADNYTLQNRDAEARALFERLLSLRNDVGLLAEEYDLQARRQVGNFPQAFSHLALIGTALSLHDVGPAQQRGRGAKPGS